MNTRTLLATLAATALMAGLMTGAAHAATTVSYSLEADGQKTTTAVARTQVETFSEMSTGQYSSVAASFSGISGTYAGLNGGLFQVNNDGYGNDGNYGVTFNAAYGGAASSGYSLTLGSLQTYFGAYIEATDATNTIQFYNGNTLVGEFDAASMLNNGVANQASRFVNMYTSAGYNRMLFTDDNSVPGGRGFESDNHTLAAVPEPASWALMMIGVGAVGASLRSRRRAVLAAA